MVEVYEDSISSWQEPDEAVRRLNMLCDALADNAYKPGARNNIAVDLAILCHELSLEPLEVAKMAWADATEYDFDDLEERLDVIEEYIPSWDQYHIESYMLGDWDCVDNPKKEWIRLV